MPAALPCLNRHSLDTQLKRASLFPAFNTTEQCHRHAAGLLFMSYPREQRRLLCLTVLPSTLLVSLPPEPDVLLEKAPSPARSAAQDSACAAAPAAAAQPWLSARAPLHPLLPGTTGSAWAEREAVRGCLACSTTTLICLFSREKVMTSTSSEPFRGPNSTHPRTWEMERGWCRSVSPSPQNPSF